MAPKLEAMFGQINWIIIVKCRVYKHSYIDQFGLIALTSKTIEKKIAETVRFGSYEQNVLFFHVQIITKINLQKHAILYN